MNEKHTNKMPKWHFRWIFSLFYASNKMLKNNNNKLVFFILPSFKYQCISGFVEKIQEIICTEYDNNRKYKIGPSGECGWPQLSIVLFQIENVRPIMRASARRSHAY